MSSSPTAPGYRWNQTAQRYVNEQGRFVSPQEVRRVIDSVIESSKERMPLIAQELQAGRITLEEFQLGMAQEIKLLHLANGAAARGGFAQMTFEDYGRVGQIVRGQYNYLQRLAGQLERGEQSLDGTSLFNRVRQYAEASRQTYEEVSRYAAARAGFTIEYNVLGSQDSCDDCLLATAMGKQPVGVLPAVGSRQCRGNCKCELRQERPADEDLEIDE